MSRNNHSPINNTKMKKKQTKTESTDHKWRVMPHHEAMASRGTKRKRDEEQTMNKHHLCNHQRTSKKNSNKGTALERPVGKLEAGGMG